MFLKNAVKSSISIYHNYLSPLVLYKCRHYPSCSQYMLEAIDDRGLLRGAIKGFVRILKCNPLFPGGYDPYKQIGR